MQTEILFLLSAFILATFVRELNGIGVLQDDLIQNDKVTDETRKNNLRQCYCVPVNYPGMKVSEYVSPNGNHNGRLVVYVYKDKNNKLIAYVPNQDKQVALPDFTLDKGERLEKLTNSAIKDLFETSSSVVIPVPNENIIAHPNIAENVPGYSYIPFGVSGHVEAPLNINDMIDLKEPELLLSSTAQIIKDNGLVPEPTPNGGEAIKIDNIELPDITNMLVSSEGLLNPDKINLDIIGEPQVNPLVEDPSVSIETPTKQTDLLVIPGNRNIASPEVSHLVDPIENNYIFSNQQQTKVINNGQPGRLEVVSQVPDMSSSVVKPSENMVYVVDPSGVDGELLISGNQSPSQLPTRPVIRTLPGNNIESYLVEQNIPGVNSQSGLSYYLPKKEPQDFFLRQNLLNQYPDYAKWIIPHGERPPKHTLTDKTFDQWLLEQVRLLQVHKPFMYHSINKNYLKILIEKTLLDNGISVSSSGVLIDYNGLPVRMDNLQLRPVLLSDPALYRKLMESNKCIIPHNIPYLEAVLVTLSYPPRLLGIIYLGQADLIEPYTITHKCNRGLCAQKIQCSTGRCNSFKNTVTKGLLGSFTRRANVEGDKDVQDLIPDSDNSLFELEDLKSYAGQNEENVNGLDKTTAKEDESNSVNEIQTPVNNVDDNDGLGIRIIGGQPATASGIPLVSRGRR